MKHRFAAHRLAANRRPDPADRLVLACTDCPKSKRSARRRPSWRAVAASLSDALGVSARRVRDALEAALQAPIPPR